MPKFSISCLFIPLPIRVYGAMLLLSALVLSPAPAAAKTVARYDLGCSVDFPCPKELQRRVDFWIEVFSRWDKNTAVLHAYNSPWQVYQTVTGISNCRDKKVKRESKRLKANLNALADRLKKDQPPQGRVQKQLATEFDRLNSKNVYKAAKNIRCQQGVKDQFTGALKRFERYKPLVVKVIKETKMPADLLYLPFVESSYRPDSYSKVGAAGMWQIMPDTARSLGMDLNAVLDERMDPEAATRGAMRYFQKAEKSLVAISKEKKPGVTRPEINPFIVTSYNYGVNGMRRAIKQIGPDFPKVLDEYKSASFQVAVKNFYASFLAARYLAINSEKHFGKVGADSVLRYQTFVLPVPTSVERIKYQFDLKESQLKDLNPALTRFAWNNWRLIPAGYQLHLPYRKHRWTSQIDKLEAMSPEPQAQNRLSYRVRKGDTACAVANAFKVNCKTLIDANQLGRRANIRIGQKLIIPGRVVKASSSVASTGKSSTSSGSYTVKSGDTACGVASRYAVACRELIRVNKLGRKAKIVVGQRLQIPGYVASDASSVATPSSLKYKVKRGDTACQIAQRYAVPCAQVISDNQLGSRAKLSIGQQLIIGGRSSSSLENVAVSKYTVRSGDTACGIAERFDVPCSTLIKSNSLGKRAKLQVGQVLKISSVVGDRTVSADASEQQREWLTRVDNLPDMTLITAADHVTLRAMPNETVAHYSDWMGTRNSAVIRSMNGIAEGREPKLGQSMKLPIKSTQMRNTFKSRRSEFHQVLTEEFKERFEIKEIKSVRIKSGQSLWSIANKYQTPMWLLIRFNPGLSSTLQPGQLIDVALIRRK